MRFFKCMFVSVVEYVNYRIIVFCKCFLINNVGHPAQQGNTTVIKVYVQVKCAGRSLKRFIRAMFANKATSCFIFSFKMTSFTTVDIRVSN